MLGNCTEMNEKKRMSKSIAKERHVKAKSYRNRWDFIRALSCTPIWTGGCCDASGIN